MISYAHDKLVSLLRIGLKNLFTGSRPAFFARFLGVLLFLALPFAARAQFYYSTNFTYVTNSGVITTNGAVTVTQYFGGGNVTVPGAVGPYPVVSIRQLAFYNTVTLRSIVIPSTVTNIGLSAFEECGELRSVSLSSGLVSIGNTAFENCSELTSIAIPDTVTNIGTQVFQNCPLTAITVDPNNPSYSSVNNVLFDKNQDTLLQYPPGVGGSYTVPSTVTSIASAAFETCNISGITFPDTVTNIGNDAFYNCGSLSSVVLPDSVTSIGTSSFSTCPSLASVTLGNGLGVIGDAAFEQTPLTSIVIPNGVGNIEIYAFYNCTNLTNVVIGTGITNITSAAFLGCSSLLAVYFQGDAPSSSGSFSQDNNATAYYLPGTLGWGSTFGEPYGLPAAPWFLPTPLILNFQHNFGVQTNRFSFMISWATNTSIVVDACTNLASNTWQAIQTNNLANGSFYFTDSQWTNYPARFYRVRTP